jgi:hypothetical protein
LEILCPKNLDSEQRQPNATLGSYASQYLERDRVGAPGSHDTFITIRTWIDTCVDTHPACKKSISGDVVPLITRLPTRVIDVGPSDGSESPYLLETKGLDGKYIALSHCWGGRACTMTTTSSLNSHYQRIRINMLSKTHKEAIATTRELGLRYIWIDSLCIVQDDPEDWFREAHLMGSVFENAFCTIAATGAKDGSIGLFTDNGRKRIRLPCEPGRPELGHMYFGRRIPNRTESVDSAPLQRRGWVLQERILSRRVIHFAEDQVYWECDEAFRYEDEPPNMLPFRRSDISRTRAKISNLIQSRRNHMDLQRTWSLILKAYVGCSLTRKSDKLVAIDGLAKRIEEATAFRYHNGIWFGNLPTKDGWCGLTWFAGEKSLVRPARVRAPSWSWAAMDGEFFWYKDFIRDFKGTSALINVISPTSPEFPMLSTLILRGRTRSASRAKRRHPAGFIRGCFIDHSYRFYSFLDSKGVEQGWVSFDDDLNEPCSFSCVEIARVKSGVGCLFLTIVPCTILSEPVSFQRVGAGFCSLPSWFDEAPNETLYLI